MPKREIEFRGKSLDNGEWIYGYYVYTHDRHRIIFEDYESYYCEEEVFPESVGKYTGLKDKNRTKIYEGDIIKITGEQEFDVGYSCPMKDNAIVKWDENECGYYLDVIKKRTVNFSDFESTSIDTFPLRKWSEEEWWIEYEVVGNIYGNIDLLTKDR